MEISLVAEPIFKIAGFTVTNSLLASYSLTLILIIFILFFRRQPLQKVPGGRSLQNVVEFIIETLYNTFEKVTAEQTKKLFPLAATYFLFIILSNWLGLLPGFGSIGIWETLNNQKILVPILRGPTADLNTTLALALISVFSIQYFGLKNLGLRYLKKFFNFSSPIMSFVGALDLLSEFSKILSFSFRLFGNIFAGEVLLAVIAFLIPVLAPMPFLGLELFVGLIQAFVFTMLSLVFLKVAISQEH
jgi:F-type H+-transporting ATPase subunit a